VRSHSLPAGAGSVNASFDRWKEEVPKVSSALPKEASIHDKLINS